MTDLKNTSAKPAKRPKNYVASPTGAAFMRSDAFIRGMIGPFGSGKSTAMIIEIGRRSMMQEPDVDGVRRTRWAVVRNTKPQLYNTTIKSWLMWFPDGVAGQYMRSRNEFLLSFQLADGTRVEAEILFQALDKPGDEQNLLSLELTGAWINEFREIDPDLFTGLISRIGRYPSPSMGVEPTWCGIIMDSNPFDVDTPYYKLFMEDASDEVLKAMSEVGASVPKIELYRQPSGLSPNAENIENLPGGRAYYTNMLATAKMQGRDENWIKVHVHGEFGSIIEGRPVYADSFGSERHIIQSYTPDRRRAVVVGMDFGYTNPAAVFLQQTPSGQWVAFHEVIATSTPTTEFIELVRRDAAAVCPDCELVFYGDPAGMQSSQVDARNSFDVIKAAGFRAYPSERGVETRISAVRACLTRLLPSGPALLVTANCHRLIRGFLGGYHFRRIRTSSERFEEKPNKNEFSHIHDALQYALAYFEASGLVGGVPRRYPDVAGSSRRSAMMVADTSFDVFS